MQFYKINEFAEQVGISTSTLREYERKGILLPHHYGLNGYRYYSQEQVDEYLSGDLSRCKCLQQKEDSDDVVID